MKLRAGTIVRFNKGRDDGAPIIIRGKHLTEDQYLRYVARWQAQLALKRGWITKKPCYICGSAISEKHHPDYERPLYVVWLCRQHHRMVDCGKLCLFIVVPHS